MKVKVDIDTKTFVRFLLVVTGFVAVILAIWKLWTALMIVAIAAFLALALNPPVSALASRLPGHSRVLATAVAYVFMLAVIGVFIYIALPPIINETNRFIASLPEYIQDLSNKKGVIANLINTYNLQPQLDQLVAGAQTQAASLAQGVGSSLVTGISSILSGFVTMLTVLVLTFLMLIEGPVWMERLWSLYRDAAKLVRHQKLAIKMYKVVTSYVNGQVLVASIAAAAGLTVLLLLTYFFPQLPASAAIPLTGLIFITDLIPMIGATIGAVIVTAVIALNDFGAAIVFVIYFVIYQQIENNFIQPLVQSRTVALSALSVLVSVIVGISLLGLVGGIVAIPVAGCIRVILIDYMEHRRRKPEPSKQRLWHKLVAKAAAND
ncbi:MAG TPA: AI-2E family transporter [Candidatus Saccharimonadales bacterium]|nr:AI-2E family transporter [Candidatus Saccharimonadales bacterium]